MSDELRMVYLVCGSDVEWHAVIAAFATREDAERYRDEVRANTDDDMSINVEAYEIDAPRERRLGAWLARVDRDGRELAAPHWFVGASPSEAAAPLTGGWEGGWQAWAATKQEAFARARAALASAQAPTDSPVSIHQREGV